MPYASTPADLVVGPWLGDPNLILDGVRPLVVLLAMISCRFPLILITLRHPRGSSASQAYASLPALWGNPPISLGWSESIPQSAQELLSLSIQMHVDSNAWGVQRGQVGILTSSLIKSVWLLVKAGLPLELRPLGQQSINHRNRKQKFCWWLTRG